MSRTRLFSELSDKRLIGSIDKTKMFVGTSDQKGKKLCCPYCYKLFCKLSRHVEEKHKDVADVQKLLAIPKGNCSAFFILKISSLLLRHGYG